MVKQQADSDKRMPDGRHGMSPAGTRRNTKKSWPTFSICSRASSTVEGSCIARTGRHAICCKRRLTVEAHVAAQLLACTTSPAGQTKGIERERAYQVEDLAPHHIVWQRDLRHPQRSLSTALSAAASPNTPRAGKDSICVVTAGSAVAG